MPSYWYLFLSFCGPHLLCLVDTCAGSVVPTNETTILLIPAEKRVTFHAFKEPIGETCSFTGFKTEAVTAAVGPGLVAVRKSATAIPGIAGMDDTANMKTTDGYYVGNINTAATGVAATGVAATGVAATGVAATGVAATGVVAAASGCSGSGDSGDLTILGDRTLSEITIRDVEDEGVNDTNKSRRQPDLETSCAFCLENVVYDIELTELHS